MKPIQRRPEVAQGQTKQRMRKRIRMLIRKEDDKKGKPRTGNPTSRNCQQT